MSTTAAWKKKQTELGIKDEQISHSVKRKISKFEKLCQDQTNYQNAVSNANSTVNSLEKGTPKYRKAEKEAQELGNGWTEISSQVNELDEQLTDDMIRLHANKDKYAAMAQHLKKPGSKAAPAISPLEPVSILLMITKQMEVDLQALKYTIEDIATMKPEDAQKIIAEKLEKPNTVAGPAPQPAPAPKPAAAAPQRTNEPKPTTTAKPASGKKGTPVFVTVLLAGFSFLGGVLMGRKFLKK